MDHSVFELVLAHLFSDDRNFLLRESDWLAASGTNITAHRRIVLLHRRLLGTILEDYHSTSVTADADSWRVSSIIFCEWTHVRSSE